MYIDSVILFSLIVVAFTCAIVVYLGIYALKHVRKDIRAAEKQLAENSPANCGAAKKSVNR